MKAALNRFPLSGETLKVFALLGVGTNGLEAKELYARKPYLKGL